MTSNRPFQYVCGWCKTLVEEKDILTAPSPFLPEDILQGCPHCRLTNLLKVKCDNVDCNNPATCGTTTAKGYFYTCDEHILRDY